MKALLFLPREERIVQEIDIPNTLKALQEAVGGYIETVTFAKDACLIVNEEGHLRDLPKQRILGATFFGNVLMVGVAGEEFTDLPEGFIEKVNRRYAPCVKG